MAKTIQVGDKVRAHLNAAYHGTVIEVFYANSKTYLNEGSQTKIQMCRVEMPDGRQFKIKASELYIEEF